MPSIGGSSALARSEPRSRAASMAAGSASCSGTRATTTRRRRSSPSRPSRNVPGSVRLAPTLVACALLVAATAAAEPLSPNELGRVMILEYHKIDRPEARWTRTPENFRRDLQRLWERGYRLVALSDFLDRKINLPRGMAPVILTFDDSSPGQFR